MKEGLLALWPRLSVPRYRDLKNCFGTVQTALQANYHDLCTLPWAPELIFDFNQWKNNQAEHERILAQFEQENISILTCEDKDYPPLLSHVHDPPFALFVKGTLINHQPHLAVVGSRKATEYGRNVVQAIIPELAKAGFSIVSGLATGIDCAAHEAALKGQGHTVAVLGFGISQADLSRPKRLLADKILAAGGAIVSEYVPGTLGSHFTFPLRNRIIAGLCQGTLVIEAKAESGALITANYASDNGREVMITPHSIFSTTSEGIHNLFKTGAHPVTSATDILEVYGFETNKPVKAENLTGADKEIIALIRTEPLDRDSLARSLKIPIYKLATLLTNLEIQGMIRVKNNQYYAL